MARMPEWLSTPMPKSSIVSDLPMIVGERMFSEFLASNDTLRVYKDDRLIFASGEDRLLPLIEYIEKSAPYKEDVIVFDRVVGNAAALLLKKILCQEVYSPLGSELAVRTLSDSGISYHFTEAVPCIQNESRTDMCPMERLSMGKQSEEFYQLLMKRRQGQTA